nr:HMP-PP phosphatase [Candidatus Pantoea persica]
MVDPEHSVFCDYWHSRDASLRSPRGSLIEDIGRPRVEPSFMPDVIDEVMKVPDGATLAAMLKLAQIIGRKPGASTSTNFWDMMQVVVQQMRAQGERGSLVTLIATAASAILTATTTPTGWRSSLATSTAGCASWNKKADLLSASL